MCQAVDVMLAKVTTTNATSTDPLTRMGRMAKTKRRMVRRTRRTGEAVTKKG
jgi:hypothetical protein